MSLIGSNGRPLKDKTLTHNVTVEEAHEIAAKIVEHYMAQLPGLIETMMTAALTAYDDAKRGALVVGLIDVPQDGTVQ